MNCLTDYLGYIILVMVLIIDIITGIAKAYNGKSEKTKNGKFNSAVMRKCGFTKISILLFVIAVNLAAFYFGFKEMGSLCLTYYVVMEILSIGENLTALGVPLPKAIVKFFEDIEKGEK